MSPVHQVWPKLSCKAQWKGEEDKSDRGRGWKTTSGNGQAWSWPSPKGQWRTGQNGGNWLWNHLWYPNNHRCQGIDDDDDEFIIGHIISGDLEVKIRQNKTNIAQLWRQIAVCYPDCDWIIYCWHMNMVIVSVMVGPLSVRQCQNLQPSPKD